MENRFPCSTEFRDFPLRLINIKLFRTMCVFLFQTYSRIIHGLRIWHFYHLHKHGNVKLLRMYSITFEINGSIACGWKLWSIFFHHWVVPPEHVVLIQGNLLGGRLNLILRPNTQAWTSSPSFPIMKWKFQFLLSPLFCFGALISGSKFGPPPHIKGPWPLK